MKQGTISKCRYRNALSNPFVRSTTKLKETALFILSEKLIAHLSALSGTPGFERMIDLSKVDVENDCASCYFDGSHYDLLLNKLIAHTILESPVFQSAGR